VIALEALRFTYDDPACYGLEPADEPGAARVLGRALTQHVRVGEQVLPRIHRAARTAAGRLEIEAPLAVFVEASAEPHASCVQEAGDERVLVFVSAAVVRLLSDAELLFVLGHELGHLKLGHFRYPRDPEGKNLRYLELQRASEISADRAGLVAAADGATALRAMLKIASGLDESQLELDVAAYAAQVDEVAASVGDETVLYSTHPPFPLRARALLGFEDILARALRGEPFDASLRALDDTVRAGLEAAAAGSAGNRFTELARSAAFWSIANGVCVEGRYPLADQTTMRAHFGDARVDGLRELLGQGSRAAGIALVAERAASSRESLRSAPTLAERLYDTLVAGYPVQGKA
jgi:hypothetical protein